MFSTQIENLSEFLHLGPMFIGNFVTLIVIVVMLYFILQSGLDWLGIAIIFIIVMSILEIFGLSSDFNIITIITDGFKDFLNENLPSWLT